MDVVTVFLNPLIEEMEIYIELLDGYKKDGFIILLYKTLYSLK